MNERDTRRGAEELAHWYMANKIGKLFVMNQNGLFMYNMRYVRRVSILNMRHVEPGLSAVAIDEGTSFIMCDSSFQVSSYKSSRNPSGWALDFKILVGVQIKYLKLHTSFFDLDNSCRFFKELV